MNQTLNQSETIRAPFVLELLIWVKLFKESILFRQSKFGDLSFLIRSSDNINNLTFVIVIEGRLGEVNLHKK